MLHVRIHTNGASSDEPPIACSRCSAFFPHKDLLQHHRHSCGDGAAQIKTQNATEETKVDDKWADDAEINIVDGMAVDIDVVDDAEAPVRESAEEDKVDLDDPLIGSQQQMFSSFAAPVANSTSYFPTKTSVSEASNTTHIIFPPQLLFSPTSGVFISTNAAASSSAIAASSDLNSTGISGIPANSVDFGLATPAAVAAPLEFAGFPSSSSLIDSTNYDSLNPTSTSTTIPLTGVIISRPSQTSSSVLSDHDQAQSSIMKISSGQNESAVRAGTMMASDSHSGTDSFSASE